MKASTTAVQRTFMGIAGLLLATACGKQQTQAIAVQTAPVERRDIVVEAQATGTVEPADTVEVKSKASGLIRTMPVDVGSNVVPGELLVQIDTRDLKNQYDQSLAALRAAQAKMDISTAAKKRSDQLFAEQTITATEHETATLDYANAQAQLVAARTNLDLAKQRLEDATVRAPVAGTVISKTVAVGTVITSATSSFGGGTTLLKIADLTKVRMRALVNETDIGNVSAGQNATVTVDAFPNRRFVGVVQKIEPEAVVQQSVTMFPVLISLQNADRALLPGMNGQVTMIVNHQNNVLAVPNDAVRSMRDVATAAEALGLNPDTVTRAVQAQMRGGRGTEASRQGEGGRNRGGQGGNQGAAAGHATGGLGGGAAGSVAGGGRRNMQIVFVKTATGWAPRVVRLGVSNFDYSEVLSGVKEGDQVALLTAAVLQQQREDRQNRIRSIQGNGLPGSGKPAGGRGRPGGR